MLYLKLKIKASPIITKKISERHRPSTQSYFDTRLARLRHTVYCVANGSCSWRRRWNTDKTRLQQWLQFIVDIVRCNVNQWNSCRLVLLVWFFVIDVVLLDTFLAWLCTKRFADTRSKAFVACFELAYSSDSDRYLVVKICCARYVMTFVHCNWFACVNDFPWA